MVGKLVANPKGFSSVIGTVFMVLVVMLLSTSVFLWTLSQNTLYNEAVKEKNQLEIDRLNERVKAFDAIYTPANDGTGNVLVSAELQNQGPLSVQIINLWVRDINMTLNCYNFSGPLNINLQPGGDSTLTINVKIDNVKPGDRFSSWLITGRGNVVPIQEKETKKIIIAEVAAGIGAISMDFYAFKYYNVTKIGSSWFLENYTSGGRQGYVVSFSRDIAFQVNLTNYDPDERDIVLSSGSLLWILFPTLPNQPRCRWWYIVNVDGNGNITGTFTPITLPHGIPTIVFFASAQDMSEGFSPSPSGAGAGGALKLPAPGVVNLMLVGNWAIGLSNFGQNVPFVTVFVKP